MWMLDWLIQMATRAYYNTPMPVEIDWHVVPHMLHELPSDIPVKILNYRQPTAAESGEKIIEKTILPITMNFLTALIFFITHLY